MQRVIVKAIRRNFGGLSLDLINEVLQQHFKELKPEDTEYHVNDLIRENLLTRN